jgi:translocation and assembly module TamB
MKRILPVILILLLMIPIGLLGLMNSATGSHWLLQTIFSSLPAQVSVTAIEGQLLDRIELSGLRYKSEAETVAVKHLVFAWQPSKLFSGVLKIADITLNEVNISVTETTASEKSTFDFNAELRLPVQVVIENLLLTDLKLQQDDKIQQLERLHLSAFTEHDRLNLVSLDINAEPVAATTKGQIGLGKGFPLSLTTDWRVTTADYGLWQSTTKVDGDIHQLSFDNQLSSPFKSSLKGRLENLLDTPRISAHGDWQKLTWPLSGTEPQITSEQGSLELNGLLSDYQLMLNTQLIQPYLPEAHLAFKGKGSTEALSIKELELKSTAGAFQLGGDVSWKDATVFDLTATGQNFNPAILFPELPGSLTFNSHIKGKLAGKALQLDADINKLSGKLRGYPVSANGKLALAEEQLKIDTLQVVSGTNKITANGTLGQEQTALIVAIDAPALESLWSKLGGSLKGDGRLQGAWLNPSVKFQASGERLHFAEYNAEQLAVNIDYQADPKLTSKMQLSANAIKAGTVQIAKLLVDGLGTLEQHRFKADINSSFGDLSSTLTGNLKGDVWQGDISKLNLNTRDAGRWQLTNNVTVRVAQSPAGVDVTLTRACLVQQAADLCLQGHYPANGDFQFKANTTALPTNLLQVYLPAQTQLKGKLNADADINQQKGLLSGNFRVNMPANAKILLQTQQGSTEFTLGSWTASGKLKEEIISGDFDLALADRDYLRGQLQLDTGKSQALSGQVTASVINFAPLNSFVPQLSNIKGNLKANLAIAGSTGKPIANGAINFSGGSVDVTDLRLEIRDIKLQALASADRIQLSGSAKSGSGLVKLDGSASLERTAELMLSGTDFEIAKLPEAQIAVSPELKAVFAEQQGKITGKLTIPKATLQLPQIPQNAVKVSSDEVILGEKKAEKNPAVATNIDTDIDIELGKQITFSGQGLKTNLSGKLKFIKTGEKMAMYGNVDMNKATYKSYGQDLTVRKGRFMFNGPVDKPWLDVEAVRVSKDQRTTAILSVTGPLDAPKTHISSEPALPESEALAYLITGGPLNQVSQSEGDMVAAAALSYGAGKLSWISDKFGLGEFEVKQGEKLEDTLASVGRYLTPDFYVGTQVGLFNKQAVLVLKRKLTKNINIETQTGTSQRVKINYELDRD